MTLIKVLFLCTGNYYRSRMAEEIFNHLAAERRLNAQANSRGLLTSFAGSKNVGSFSPAALQVLSHYQIEPRRADEMPQRVTEQELHDAHWIIAMYQRQHAPMILAQFPEFKSKIKYWSIPDLDEMPASEAGELIYQQVADLVRQV